MKNYFIGIDLGGTFIKGGLIDKDGKIYARESVRTGNEGGSFAVASNIIGVAKSLVRKAGVTLEECEGIGIGSPGVINSKDGMVAYSNNLDWHNVPLCKMVSEGLSQIKCKITNDANAAALGEAIFGAGSNFTDSVFITLGTGVGSGIVIGGKLYEGNGSVGGEIGHMVIDANGEKCTCGRNGCFEVFSSATGLIKSTKKAMEKYRDSKMWGAVGGDLNNVSGRVPFDLYNEDKAAKEVVDTYIDYLAIGLANVGNIFRPEAILLGGGVCKQGDNLIVPLNKKVNEQLIGRELAPKVEILVASLENDAGFLGAAALLLS